MEDEAIRVLIVEDEPLWADVLSGSLRDFGFAIAGTVGTFETAVEAFNTLRFDVVLLDIHLQKKSSGIELGKLLDVVFHKPFIFITSAMDEPTLNEAVAARPSAYLNKPVNPASLFVTVQAAIRNFQRNVTASSPGGSMEETDVFFVKVGDKYKRINWKDVVYLSSERNYTLVYNAQDRSTYFIRSSLARTLQHIVPRSLGHHFVQVNRSEAVQLSFVQELMADELKTAFKTFTVTEGHHKALKAVLNIIS